jgi:DNA-directed RNA polymerase subunit omega
VELYHGFDSNYRYILVAARRARQLQNGASPLIETSSTKPCRIAEQELQADMVKWETKPVEPKELDLPDPSTGNS